MKISIVVDNNAMEFVSAEFGFSCYIEIDNKKLLFDVGYSNILIENALKLEINLHKLDFLTLSHGHHDHTWGLANLIQYYMQRLELKKGLTKPTLICCPGALEPKWLLDGHQYGNLLNKETIESFFNTKLSNTPVWITKNMVFLGKIERKIDFEKNAYRENVPLTKIIINDQLQEDQLLDDSAIACKTENGLVIITGCSHSGICNIIEYAKKVCNENRVVDVIGGFHLIDTEENRLNMVCEYFKKLNLKNLHMCHCTDTKAKAMLAKVAPAKEAGAGLVIEY
jgi:7,8-dihydropterin-6-yl-methyl-4-(beta-D-ribofuranosyl)aminobenzene 5'-phosphate synthase